MAEAMRYLAMGIAASRRLGWIALGLYIQKMNVPVPSNPFYKTLIEYHRAMKTEYQFTESIMVWADDYRMVLFPDEYVKRLDAINDGWGHYHQKEMQKATIMRRACRARLELDNAWD